MTELPPTSQDRPSFQPMEKLNSIKDNVSSRIDIVPVALSKLTEKKKLQEKEMVIYEYQKYQALREWSSENLSDTDTAKWSNASFESSEFKDVAEPLLEQDINAHFHDVPRSRIHVSDWGIQIQPGADPFGWEYSLVFSGPYRNNEFTGSRIRRRKWNSFISCKEIDSGNFAVQA